METKTVVIFVLLSVVIGTSHCAVNSFITYVFPKGDSQNEVSTTDTHITWGSFSQKVDHFNSSSTKYFQQRFLSINNTKQRASRTPIFIIVGGQSEIQETALLNSYPVDIAESVSATVFVLEQRYYGKSMPVDDLSTSNLQWLNVEQALADIAVFIDVVRKNIVHDPLAKVILIGARYGGSLAVWFKQIYPGKVAGVWASSAPLLAKVDNADVLKFTGQVFKDVGGTECYERIQSGIQIAEMLYANGSLVEFEKQFGICNLANTDYDIRFFFSTVVTLLSRIVESENLERISQFCSTLNAKTKNRALSSYIQLMFSAASPSKCTSIDRQTYLNFLGSINLTDYSAVSGARQTLYQKCSGFGWFATTSGQNQPFGTMVPVELFYETCLLAFGYGFNRGVVNERSETINAIFGGLKPGINRVLFTNGELDPWRSLSVQSEYNRECVVIDIKGEGSNSDLKSISKSDSEELKNVKQKIKSVIIRFINH